ncbi:hypothetical protein Nepgr_010766 [Nepenthes gracilis]|uniref:UBA domain-containing protein n=1 Tax=Nepenthes gracilis TaxID=150966 RepID=A0AAD3XLQ8_NEPGR|nr:hypothetical protein Nepgr_010766 [Nepenthes gracilis]
MDYDYRSRAGPSPSPYEQHNPMIRTTTSSSTPHASSIYPKIGQTGQPVINSVGRAPPYHHTAPSPSSGTGIRVAIKPEYRITRPPPLLPQMGEIPRSNFHFNFDLEKKILAEAEKENQDWSHLVSENLPSRTRESTSSTISDMTNAPAVDPVVMKYIALGLSREAVPLAVANYGDNPTKVREFVSAYSLLREMGFSSNSVADALIMYNNDTDKALAHFLNSGS